MTPLHASILLRDLKSFQRLLNVNNSQHGRSAHPGLTSGYASKDAVNEDDHPVRFRDAEATGGWGSPPKHRRGEEALGGSGINVNEKDTQGRTALHIACSSPDCVEYVRLLLKHPSINVNIPDVESHYTPLHRAMYVANLPAALLLLQRPDIDTTLKDNEGYTAFDLYNSTIEGTKPDHNDLDGELFMWGANVNATLGFSDGNNRSHPDQIVIQPKEYASFPALGPTRQDRFFPIRVRQVGMSKLHTVVVTAENGHNTCGGGNLRVCGFGSSGRLGPSHFHHTQQYALSSLPPHAFSPSVEITRVAVGQDHTLALTKSGEVYSWGMNRFAQLGYIVRNQGDAVVRIDGRAGESGKWEGRTEGRAEEGGKGANSLEDMIQHTPRRVQDALRKEVVVGVAASKMASSCWTAAGDLFTWGTNSGQLGYERASQPQVLPRKVSKLASKVIDVALSDTAMACLLIARDVICIWNDKEIKINFPTQTLLRPKNQPYRPPPRKRDPGIAKLTACDDVFAALSNNGEVFVFTTPDNSGDPPSTGKMALIKPQKAWVLKKKYRAIKDVALGANGDIIVCTESGHVFIRTRNPIKAPSLASQAGDKSIGGSSVVSGSFGTLNIGGSFTGANVASGPQPSKIGSNFNFVRVPCLQRITRVCANSTGAFGAVKVDYRHAPIGIEGNGIAEDLKEVMPFVAMYGGEEWQRTMKGGRYGLGLKSDEDHPGREPFFPPSADPDDEDVDEVKEDILRLRHLCELLDLEKKGRKDYPRDKRLPFDADVMVVSQSEAAFPAHRVILAARSHILCSVLEGGKVAKDEKTNISIRFIANRGKQSVAPQHFSSISTCGKLLISGCHAITILIFLTYLYSDEILAVWDPRVKMQLQKECLLLKVKPDQVKAELQALARMLDLPLLSDALELSVKRVPTSSVARDIGKLWLDTQLSENGESRKPSDPLAPDVLLQLADREIWCHSLLLRTRSDLFASFFGEEEWIINRRNDDGVMTLNFRHLKWDAMQYVLRFVFCGEEEELFEQLDVADSVDDVLELMFSVMSAATELLLDRLVLVCSSIILEHVNVQNACYVVSDASFFNAEQLVQRLHMYMIANLETFLEQRMLEDVPHRLVKHLAVFARKKQAEKSPISRTTVLFDALKEKYAQWLSEEDFPEPIIRPSRPQGRGVSTSTKRSMLSLSAPAETSDVFSTTQRTIRRPPSGEEIFVMDEADGSRTASDAPPVPPSKAGVWKPHLVPRIDMKSLMAEEEANLSASPPNVGFSKKPIQILRTASKDSVAGTPSPVSSMQRTSSNSWRMPANPPTTPKKPTPPNIPSDTPSSQITSTSRRHENTPRGEISSPKPQLTPTSTCPSHRLQVTPDARSPGLGPVITPTRQLSKMSTPGDMPSVRRVSGKAWTLPPVEPVIATSPTSSSVSFAAIQQLQQEQAMPQIKDKKSLRDIQAEEEARQQEKDFLRWWAEEEERVRLESEAMSRALAESQTQAGKSKRRGKGGKDTGRAKLDKPLQIAEEPRMEGEEQPRGSAERPSRLRRSGRSKKIEVPNS